MPQGQFTAADVQQAPPPVGRFTAADVDASSPGFGEGYRSGLGLPGPVSDLWSGAKYMAQHPIDAAKLLLENSGEKHLESEQQLKAGTLSSPVIDAIKAGNYPNAAGQAAGAATGGLIASGALPKAVAAVPEVAGNAASAIRPAIATAGKATEAALSSDFAGAIHPRLPYIGKLAGAIGRTAEPKATPAAPPLTPAESAEGTSWREPEAPSLADQSKAKIEPQAQYPEGLNKRPTDRAEITDDKAMEDSMRNDLEKQGWRLLSQERKEFFANNVPGLSKGDLVAQAQAESIRAEAEQRAQQVLAKAANPPVKFTKTVIPKAPAAAQAQPVAEDLNSPSRLVDLMQQSIDLINKRKGK